MPLDESPMDFELMPSGYSVGPHRNEATHWLLTEIERCRLDDNDLIKEAACRLREAEDYFMEREQDRLHLKIMQLLPLLKEFRRPLDGWTASVKTLLDNDDPEDALEEISHYLKEIWKHAQRLRDIQDGYDA